MSVGSPSMKTEDKGGGIILKWIFKEYDEEYVERIDLDQHTSYIALFGTFLMYWKNDRPNFREKAKC
jgi:hypothetical protein